MTSCYNGIHHMTHRARKWSVLKKNRFSFSLTRYPLRHRWWMRKSIDLFLEHFTSHFKHNLPFENERYFKGNVKQFFISALVKSHSKITISTSLLSFTILWKNFCFNLYSRLRMHSMYYLINYYFEKCCWFRKPNQIKKEWLVA